MVFLRYWAGNPIVAPFGQGVLSVKPFRVIESRPLSQMLKSGAHCWLPLNLTVPLPGVPGWAPTPDLLCSLPLTVTEPLPGAGGTDGLLWRLPVIDTLAVASTPFTLGAIADMFTGCSRLL